MIDTAILTLITCSVILYSSYVLEYLSLILKFVETSKEKYMFKSIYFGKRFFWNDPSINACIISTGSSIHLYCTHITKCGKSKYITKYNISHISKGVLQNKFQSFFFIKF